MSKAVNVTSGSITWPGSTTTTIIPHTTSPNSTGTISIGGGTSGVVFGNNNNPNFYGYNVPAVDQKYLVFKLPKEESGNVPNKVYVGGMLVTLGVLGSDVQAAFAGDKLVFAPGVLHHKSTFNEKLTVILDYGDWVYNYNVGIAILHDHGVDCEKDSNIAKADLLSKVAQR